MAIFFISRRLFRTNKLFINGCRYFSPLTSSSSSSSSPLFLLSKSSPTESKRTMLGFRVLDSIRQSNIYCFLNFCRYTSHAGVDQAVDGIVDIPLAQTGEGIAECELLKWFVQEGEQVEEFQPLCEVQSDKATIEITSRYKGKVLHILHAPGDIVKVGETLLKMGAEEDSSKTIFNGLSGVELNNSDFQGDSSTQTSSDDEKRYGGVLCTPAVRNLAKQLGIDISNVKGSGKDGRVLKEDILNYVGRNIEARPSAFSGSLPKLVYESSQFEDKTIQLRGFQRAMVKSMTLAARVPHFHYVEEVKCDALVELKASFQNENSDPSIKHTFLPVLVKALSVALSAYPLLNSCFVEDMHEVIVKGSHNIGIAMATPYGLAVPNIKKVQLLSVMEITKEISRLQQLAMDNKLSQEDISGGTITVSNIGAIGGKFGSPLVNLPEVAIIALGRIQKVPHIADDGTIYPLPIMNVNIGADHRVLDGATVARFCNEWKSLIEKPERLLLQLR